MARNHLPPYSPIAQKYKPINVRMAADDDSLQELPKPELLKAIAKCDNTATAADVAAAAGLDLAETRRQLLVLARLVGAELQVSEDGELLFVFDEPGALRRSLRLNSVRQRLNDVWGTISPPVYWLLRASFGLGLLSSIAIVSTALIALSAAGSDSSSSSSGGGSRNSEAVPVGRLLGQTLDLIYYTSRPYGYYGYYPDRGEKGFLQSCFSFLFGDGDPNKDLEKRTAAAAAALIRANGGAVTAEQLAPLLIPNIDPEQAAEDSSRPGAPVNEGWMLPILLQFNGEPTVTEAGDIVYVFPELMATGSQLEASGTLTKALTTQEQAAFSEQPVGWRPEVDEEIRIASTGATGTVVDRAGGRFLVRFSSGRQETFVLDKLLPTGTDKEGLYLRELPQRFSTAPTDKLVLVGTLGVANLAGVLVLGNVLGSFAGVPASALGSSGALIASLRKLYPALLAYASGWFIVPSVRAFRLRSKNRGINKRNSMREKWARVLRRSSAIDVTEESSSGEQKAREGFLARAKRKLKAAKQLRPRLKRVKRDAEGQFSTSRDVSEIASESKREMLGSGFDDFDNRLAAKIDDTAAESLRTWKE